MTKVRQAVSLIVALAVSGALIAGAFNNLRWEAMLVLAWYSAALLGKRSLVESIVHCISQFRDHRQHGDSVNQLPPPHQPHRD